MSSVRSRPRDASHHQQHQRRERERAGVDVERRAGAEVPTSTPPSAGPSNVMANGRENCASEFGLHEQAAGTRSGRIDWCAGPYKAWPTPKITTSAYTCQSSSTSRVARVPSAAIDRPADDVGRDQQPPSVEAVGEHAREQHEHDLGKAPRDADPRERAGPVPLVVDLPRDRHDVDAVAEERHDGSEPQQPEVADRERPDDAETSEPATVHRA